MLRQSSVAYPKSSGFSLRPDFIVATVADIDFRELAAWGITTCLIDLDGTVVARGQFDVPDATAAALRQSGMDIYIATNRPKSRDLKNLKLDLGAVGVIHPHGVFGKPAKRYFINAMQDKQLQAGQVVMIGDRFIQDIIGANRAGIYSLLVRKMDTPLSLTDRLFSGLEDWYASHIARGYVK